MVSGPGAFSDVLSSNVSLSVERVSKYMVSTEGTRLLHGRDFVGLSIVARGKATDGMDLVDLEDFQGADLAHLPSQAVIDAAASRVGENVSKLVQAIAVEPFVGPAILSGKAAAVFFHEIFGHRIEGHRQKDEGEGQTFTKAVGTPVLPSFLSVVFDPTRKTLGGVELNGYYSYDDEGVKARPVTVVDNGVLKTFLMSRSYRWRGPFQRAWAAAAGIRSGVAAIQPDRAIVQAGFRKRFARDAGGRDQAAE